MGRGDANKFIEEAKASMPPPGDDPLGHVKHTLGAFAHAPDGEFVVTATHGVYGKNVQTGMTWGDVRALYNMAAPADQQEGPVDG